jgi:hypothetical protein
VTTARIANFGFESIVDIKVKGMENEYTDPLCLCGGPILFSRHICMPWSRACLVSGCNSFYESSAATVL